MVTWEIEKMVLKRVRRKSQMKENGKTMSVPRQELYLIEGMEREK
jgi:hypothetical protein